MGGAVLNREKVAIVIPSYNHGTRISDVVWKSMDLGFPLFVVDDGSTDATVEILSGIEGITVVTHAENRGKGVALQSGFAAAQKTCDWAISLDADGQHNPQDVESLLAAVQKGRRPIVVGARMGMDGENVPWTSRFGRGFSNFWVRVSGGPRVTDSQSGFRLYPLPETVDLKVSGKRFQYEVEVLVMANRAGIPVVEAPVQVVYQQGAERISHFHPWKDFLRNSVTFSRLIIWRIFGLRKGR